MRLLFPSKQPFAVSMVRRIRAGHLKRQDSGQIGQSTDWFKGFPTVEAQHGMQVDVRFRIARDAFQGKTLRVQRRQRSGAIPGPNLRAHWNGFAGHIDAAM